MCGCMAWGSTGGIERGRLRIHTVVLKSRKCVPGRDSGDSGINGSPGLTLRLQPDGSCLDPTEGFSLPVGSALNNMLWAGRLSMVLHGHHPSLMTIS